jgi:hypothetical protein
MDPEVAEQLRVGMEIMEQHRETLAALAKDSDLESPEKPILKSVISDKDQA